LTAGVSEDLVALLVGNFRVGQRATWPFLERRPAKFRRVGFIRSEVADARECP
jgi:hypothetical protein